MKHEDTPPRIDRGPRRHTKPGSARLTLLSHEPWTHSLVLTGDLNGRTAAALEEEVETLTQEGVAVLRLDLRSLESIDELGIAVIAFRSRECARAGCTIEVLTEVPSVRSALTDAGVALVRKPGLAVVGPPTEETRALGSR